jgi:hypothetical protein
MTKIGHRRSLDKYLKIRRFLHSCEGSLTGRAVSYGGPVVSGPSPAKGALSFCKGVLTTSRVTLADSSCDRPYLDELRILWMVPTRRTAFD